MRVLLRNAWVAVYFLSRVRVQAWAAGVHDLRSRGSLQECVPQAAPAAATVVSHSFIFLGTNLITNLNLEQSVSAASAAAAMTQPVAGPSSVLSEPPLSLVTTDQVSQEKCHETENVGKLY